MTRRSLKHGAIARWCASCEAFVPTREWAKHNEAKAKCLGADSVSGSKRRPRAKRTCCWCGRSLFVNGHSSHEKSCGRKAKELLAARGVVPVSAPDLQRGVDGLPSSLLL